MRERMKNILLVSSNILMRSLTMEKNREDLYGQKGPLEPSETSWHITIYSTLNTPVTFSPGGENNTGIQCIADSTVPWSTVLGKIYFLRADAIIWSSKAQTTGH